MATAGAYDWDVSGLKFISAVSPEMPYERAFARVLKEQVDNSSEPGDQSFDGVWVRSQTDWSAGAGYEWMEPISVQPIPSTFNWSYGVDVFSTPGLIHLYRASVPVNHQHHEPHMAVAGGRLWFSDGNVIHAEEFQHLLPLSGPAMPWHKVHTFTSDVTGIVSAQGYAVVSTAGEGIWNCTRTQQVQTYTSTLPVQAWYVKDRLVVAQGGRVHVVAVAPSSPPVDLNAATPAFAKTEIGWTWVDTTQGPGAIYIAGSGADQSGIYSITIDPSGAVPTLTSPREVAAMPLGEKIKSIDAYLGSYLLIGTNLGVRLGLIKDSGDIQYGPILKHCPPPTGGFTFYGQYAWAPVDDAGEGRSGVVQFDLGGITEEQRVPWANAERVPVGSTSKVTSAIAVHDDYLVMGCADGSIYISRPANDRESTGVIQSGWIRMGTTVEKNWQRLGLIMSPEGSGAVTAFIVDGSAGTEVGTLIAPGVKGSWPIALTSPTSRAAVRLVFHNGTLPPVTPPTPPPLPGDPIPGPPPGAGELSWGGTLGYTWDLLKGSYSQWLDLSKPRTVTTRAVAVRAGAGNPGSAFEQDPELRLAVGETPAVEAWSLRATPSVPRSELIRMSLLCFDREVDQKGQTSGRQGDALVRYQQLVDATKNGASFTLQDLNNETTYFVSLEDMSFKQVAPPERAEGFGGIIDITVKTV